MQSIGHLQMRVKPSDKERMSRAAELTGGVKLTTFVRASPTDEAERIPREHRTMVLSERYRRSLVDGFPSGGRQGGNVAGRRVPLATTL